MSRAQQGPREFNPPAGTPQFDGKRAEYVPRRPANTAVFRDTPSLRGQWQEGSQTGFGPREITPREVEEFRNRLAESYDCNPRDITHKFRRIDNIYEENDVSDCIELFYTLTYVDDKGVTKQRIIYTLKVKVPENIKQAARRR